MTKNEDLKAIKGLRDIAMKLSLDKASPNDGLDMFNLIAVLDNPEKYERIKHLEILVSAQDKIISNLATRPTVTPTDTAMEDAPTREDGEVVGALQRTSSTTDGDAERAFQRYSEKFCSIGYDPTDDVRIIQQALQSTRKQNDKLAKLRYALQITKRDIKNWYPDSEARTVMLDGIEKTLKETADE